MLIFQLSCYKDDVKQKNVDIPVDLLQKTILGRRNNAITFDSLQKMMLDHRNVDTAPTCCKRAKRDR